MTLRITVKNAADLPNVEKEGKLIDPYVALEFRGLKKKTSKKENTLNPVWDEEFQWTLETALNPAEVLQIELYDSQPLNRNRLIGSFDYSLGVLLDQKERCESLKLIPSKNARAVKNWEKTVMLNFKMLPVELFEKNIEIKVIDRNKKKNYVIGVFSIDVGSINNEPSHSFIHKWLVLSDCTDASFGARVSYKIY